MCVGLTVVLQIVYNNSLGNTVIHDVSAFQAPALWLFGLSASLVCVGCLLPAKWIPPIKHDKAAHFVAFAGLVFIARMNTTTLSELLVWLAGLTVAGLLIEILQQFVPGRHFCWEDMRANAAGILVASIFCIVFDYVR